MFLFLIFSKCPSLATQYQIPKPNPHNWNILVQQPTVLWSPNIKVLCISPKPTSQSKGKKKKKNLYRYTTSLPFNTHKTILDNIFICYMYIGWYTSHMVYLKYARIIKKKVRTLLTFKNSTVLSFQSLSFILKRCFLFEIWVLSHFTCLESGFSLGFWAHHWPMLAIKEQGFFFFLLYFEIKAKAERII